MVLVTVALQKEFGNVHSQSIIWKTLRNIGISSSLKLWYNSALKPSSPGLVFIGRFFENSFYVAFVSI